MASGWRPARAATASGRRMRSGWYTGSRNRSAASFTGEAVSCWPRPLGRSGWVTTQPTSCPAATRASSGSRHHARRPLGLPVWELQKRACREKPGAYGGQARRPVLLPFSGFCQLADFATDQVALQGADVADVQLAVQVVGFVQKGARQQVFAGLFEELTLGVLRAHRYALGTLDLLAERGNAQATFFAFLLAFHAHNFRIDEHQLVRRILGVGYVDDGDLAGEPDLRRRQPDALGGVHGLEHVFQELVELRRAEIGDLLRFTLQHRIAVLHDWINHNSEIPHLSQITFKIAFRFAERIAAELFQENGCGRARARPRAPASPAFARSRRPPPHGPP